MTKATLRIVLALAVAVGALTAAIPVRAQQQTGCTTQTYIINGRIITCVVCYYPGVSSTTTCN